MDGRINAQEGRKQRQICGQKLRFRPTTIMISPSPSKVNNPCHLADFAAFAALRKFRPFRFFPELEAKTKLYLTAQ